MNYSILNTDLQEKFSDLEDDDENSGLPGLPDYVIEDLNRLGELVSDKSGTAEVSDKSGTAKGRKNESRDREFVHDLWRAGFFKRHYRRRAPFSRFLPPVTLHKSPSTTRKLKPNLWRDTGQKVRALMFHEALAREQGVRVKGFTLRLGTATEALARSKGKGCLRWLHKRVERELKRLSHLYPSGKAPFWFAIEEGDRTGNLHIHGEIAIPIAPGEKVSMRTQRRIYEGVRKALLSAGGKWDANSDQFQLVWSGGGAPDCGWAGYCVKNADTAWPTPFRVAELEAKVLTASSGLSVKARELYGALSADLMKGSVVPAVDK